MNAKTFIACMTVFNVALVVWNMSATQTADAASDDILRGTGLEIVDGEGRLRAQLVLAPADSDFEMPDGTVGYPETVIFRLITADGKPRVKITSSETSSGLMLLGESDSTHTIMQSKGSKTSIKLRNNETAQLQIEP